MKAFIRNLFTRILANKSTTQHLEVSQKILSSIAQTAQDAIIIADANDTIIFYNKKASDLFGYPGQEMLASKFSLLLSPKYGHTLKKGIERFVAKGSDQLLGRTLGAEGVKKDGTIFSIELSLSFWQQQGIYLTAIIRDTTRRKQIEQQMTDQNKQLQKANEELIRIQELLKESNQALEVRVAHRTRELVESEKQLRLITDALPVLISYIDKEQKYRFTNQAYEGWFLLDREAILGKTMREIAGDIAYAAVQEQIQQVLSGQMVSFERQMNYQRADSRYVSFHFIPRWEENQVIGFYLLATDITQRKKIEEEVKAASRRLTLLLESIPHLAWTSSAEDSSINFFNKRWYEFTGLTSEQSLGYGWQQVLHPEDLAFAISKRTQGRKQREAYAVENRYRMQDGSYRWHLARVVPVMDENRQIILWLGTATDIHEQKMLQQALHSTSLELAASNEELRAATEELRASNEELAEANRTVLDINQKLVQTNIELEVSNEQLIIINTDLDNFIYTASHDLKAPIANIEGLIIALAKKLSAKLELDDEQNRIISMIAASVDRLKATIANLTEIAKAQKEDVENQPVSVETVLEEVEQDLAKLIEEAEVRLIKNIEIDYIQMAPKNLRSILYNLLSNALKYRSFERPAQVYIETKKEDKTLLLVVKDNGIGMAENNLQKLFTMFRRFHTHVEGTGIGLYIVKRIVENQGGKVVVESQLNRGTTFTISLPLPEKS